MTAPPLGVFSHSIDTGSEKGKKYAAPTIAGTAFLVDDNGLEPLTLRTSSECSTS